MKTEIDLEFGHESIDLETDWDVLNSIDLGNYDPSVLKVPLVVYLELLVVQNLVLGSEVSLHPDIAMYLVMQFSLSVHSELFPELELVIRFARFDLGVLSELKPGISVELDPEVSFELHFDVSSEIVLQAGWIAKVL